MKRSLAFILGFFLLAVVMQGILTPSVKAGIPSVVSTAPSQNQYAVAANSSITVTFSEAIDTGTVDSDSFMVIGEFSGKRSSGAFNFSAGDTVVEFVPTDGLDAAGERVLVVLTTDIESAATSDGLDQTYAYQYTVAVTGGDNDLTFGYRQIYTNNQGLGVRPSHHDLGDLDGDGDLDLVVSNINDGLDVWYNDGTGVFGSPLTLVTSTPGVQGRAMYLAPMDDNDSLDIVYNIANDDLRVYLNDGSGSFPSQMTVNYFVGSSFLGEIVVGDFNNDGFFDVANSGYFDSNTSVFLNQAGASLDFDASYAASAGVEGFQVADFDNDFDLDIQLENRIMRNDGAGTFTVEAVIPGSSATARKLSTDRFLPGDTNYHTVSLTSSGGNDFFRNNGAGSFTKVDLSDFEVGEIYLESGDMDADGDPDLLVTADAGRQWNVVVNDSFGTSPIFSEEFFPSHVNGEAESVRLGDLNNDGALDMVIAEEVTSGAPYRAHFSVWYGHPTPQPVAENEFVTFLGGGDYDGAEDGVATFHVRQLVDGEWEKVYQHSFPVEYETDTFEVTPHDASLELRFVQKTMDFGDIEFIQLSHCGAIVLPDSAQYVETGDDVMADILEDDLNVINVHEREIEVSWSLDEECEKSAEITLKANEYPRALPLRFPEEDAQTVSYVFDERIKSLDMDGRLDEVDGQDEPQYAPLWQPVTGHPDGETLIYLSNDEEYWYLALDITMDNTDEWGEDFTEVVVLQGGEERVFRVDDFTDEYGVCAFGLTSAVSYKHQTCELNIPREELSGEQIDFFLRYYGTGGGGPTFDFNYNHRSQGIAIDSSGDIYVVGRTDSLDFPTTGGVIDTSGDVSGDVFISKLSGDGTTLIWSTFLGGSDDDFGSEIDVDVAGNVYVGGTTQSSDFPATEGAYEDQEDVFVAVLNSTGTFLDYAFVAGGEDFDRLGAMELHGAGPEVYFSGQACGNSGTVNYPTTTGAFSETIASGGFVCRGFFSIIDPQISGVGTLVYSTFLSGESSAGSLFMNEAAIGLDVDGSGRAHMTGYSLDSGQATPGAAETFNDSFGSGYYAVIDPQGSGPSDLDYYSYMGFVAAGRSLDIALNSNDDVVIVGEGNDSFGADGEFGDLANDGNITVVIMTPDGTGSSDVLYQGLVPFDDVDNEPLAIAIDASDRVHMVGVARSVDTTGAAYDPYGEDFESFDDDAFYAVFSLDSNAEGDQLYMTKMAGDSTDVAQDIVVDAAGNNAYIVGTTEGDFFEATVGAYDETFNGDHDTFVAKFTLGTATVPDAINDLNGTPGTMEVDLSWSAPNDNGDPITDYIVEFRDLPGGSFAIFPEGVSTVTSALVTGLTNGTDYEFRVFAVNGSGQSPSSNVITVTPGALASGGQRGRFASVGGPQFFLGRVLEFQGNVFSATGLDQLPFSNFRGAAGSGGDFTAFSDLMALSQEQADLIMSGRDVFEGGTEFTDASLYPNFASAQRTRILSLLDLILALRKTFAWAYNTPDYQLTRSYTTLAQEYQSLFRTRWFHRLVGVEYLRRGNLDAYEFDYREALTAQTDIVVFMMRSVLLTFGKSCFPDDLLEYAEEIDQEGNEFWFERYVEIMKPWMDEVLDSRSYQMWRTTGDVNMLDALYLFLYGFCLNDSLS